MALYFKQQGSTITQEKPPVVASTVKVESVVLPEESVATLPDLRLELRKRNNRLWHLIFDQGMNVASFCRAYGFCSGSQSIIGDYLNLNRSPYNKRDGSPTGMALRLAVIAKCVVEDLFPVELYALSMVSERMVAEIPSHAFCSLGAARRLTATGDTPIELVRRGELRQVIEQKLDTLYPREALVLKSRYGLVGDGVEQTLDEVANSLGVSKERIRQIEAKALRKLRHPSRAKALREYVVGMS